MQLYDIETNAIQFLVLHKRNCGHKHNQTESTQEKINVWKYEYSQKNHSSLFIMFVISVSKWIFYFTTLFDLNYTVFIFKNNLFKNLSNSVLILKKFYLKNIKIKN